MILQSKMNIADFGYRFESNYRKARNFMELLPFDSWIQLSQIPNEIKFEVIDMIDGGYSDFILTELSPDDSCFLLTKKSIYNVLIEARIIDLKIVKGLNYCYKCKKFKAENKFFESMMPQNNHLCKSCYKQHRK